VTDLLKLAEDVVAGRVKALSILQPYPHHIFHGGKNVENRDWPTKGRGWFIVHAGKSARMLDRDDPQDPKDPPMGGIVGMARITDCVEAMDSPWFFGRYGFVLAGAFPVPLIPCRGMRGFFMPPQESLDALAKSICTTASGSPE
jgi:hypothetical protein